MTWIFRDLGLSALTSTGSLFPARSCQSVCHLGSVRVPCSQREEHKPAQPSWCRAHPLWSKLASLHTQGHTQIPRQLHHDIHVAHRQVSQSMDTRTKAALSHFTVYQGLPFPAMHAGKLKLISAGESRTDLRSCL